MKNLKPLKTEKDYEAALKEVERVWSARLGTPEGDRPLDILATLIDAYESEHYRDGPTGSSRSHQIPHGTAGPVSQESSRAC